jgi:hypothetical protein
MPWPIRCAALRSERLGRRDRAAHRRAPLLCYGAVLRECELSVRGRSSCGRVAPEPHHPHRYHVALWGKTGTTRTKGFDWLLALASPSL